MKLIEQIYKDKIESKVKYHYKTNLNYFKSLSMDYEDVKQLIQMEMLYALNKYKTDEKKEEELTKILSMTGFNKLRKLYNKKYYIMNSYGRDLDVYDFTDDESKTPEQILKDLLTCDEPITELQYEILYKKLIELKSIIDIAKELNLKPFTISNNLKSVIESKSNNMKVLTGIVNLSGLGIPGHGGNYPLSSGDYHDIESDLQELSTMPSFEDILHQYDMTAFLRLKQVLTDTEYMIVYMMFYENQSKTEIKKELNLSRYVFEMTYKNALKKLKKFYKN